MGEPLKAGDYFGEYTGEVISGSEADRRGVIYDLRQLSYLFTITKRKSALSSHKV